MAGLTYVSDSFIKVTATDTYIIRTYAEVKADLDLEIGTDIQAYNAALTSISGLTYISPSFIKLTGNDTYAVRTITEVITDLALDSDDLSDVAFIAMLDENEDITGAWTLSTGSIAGVDATEFSYLDGVASDIQTQFGLRYLKTEMDDFSELQTIIPDKTLINEEDAIILDNDLVFEGSTPNEFETTFAITDPTADRTIAVPDSDQTIGTATSIQDNLILKADLAEEDWGDVNITVGNVAEVQDLTIANEAQGDILYFNGANWVRLVKGIAGQVLTMNAGATAPEWQTP
ncbi:hypothetical protein ES708_27198 [subsurface metagenome]